MIPFQLTNPFVFLVKLLKKQNQLPLLLLVEEHLLLKNVCCFRTNYQDKTTEFYANQQEFRNMMKSKFFFSEPEKLLC